MRRRGFTILEIVVSVAIMGLVMLAGFSSLFRAKGQAGANGMALAVADVFRQARQDAVAGRRPVAVVLPTSSGTRGSASAYYLVEGEALPQVTRVRSFDSEYRGIHMFVGTWPLASGTYTTTVNMPGSKWSNFNLTSWLPPASVNDFAFCYLPDGTLRCNGLPNFDGSYHVAICTGLSYSGGAGSFNLTRAGACFTISLSPAGAVSVEGGLTGQNGSVPLGGTMPAPPAAAPPPTSSLALQDPVFVQEPQIYPLPNQALLPPSVNATLTKDQFLSLESIAKSPSGHPLYCRWQVVAPVPAPGPGRYSFPGNGGRMVWDPQANPPNGAWKSVWQWRPPPTAQPNDIYNLQCVVQNYGGTPLAAQIKKIQIIPPGNVFFETNRGGAPEIWSMNEDGSRQQIYLTGCKQPSANLDGTRLVYIKNSDDNIYLMHPAHPSNPIQLTFNGNYSIPAISPNGTKVAFRRQTGPNYGLHVMKISSTGCASNVTIETDSPIPAAGPYSWTRTGTERLAWSPDGHSLLYTKLDGHGYKADIGDGPGANPVLNGPPVAYLKCQPPGENPVWNPSWGVNNRIYYSINNTGLGALYDPYVFYVTATAGPITSWNWGRDSYNIEQIMMERDPAGGDLVMATEQPAPIPGADEAQIIKMNTAVPMGFSLGSAPRVWLTNTPGFYNTRPCWTQ